MLIYSRVIIGSKFLLLMLLSFSLPVQAEGEWLANTGLGVTYNDNYALQNGDYTNIEQIGVDRTGMELTGAVSWQTFNVDGGFGVDASALLDKATDRDSNISLYRLSASRIQPLSMNWISRFSAGLLQYGNDDFKSNAYDGINLEMTMGWFGEQGQGADMTLGWINEDHQQDADSLYEIQRLKAALVYYFPYMSAGIRNSVTAGVQSHDSTDDRRDGSSLLLGADMEQIRWGKSVLRMSISWRQDRYDQAYTPLPGDAMAGSSTGAANPSGSGHGNGPGNGPGNGSGNGPGSPSGSASPRTDTQAYLSASYQYPFNRSLTFFLNASTGIYTSEGESESFYNVYSGVRFYFY